MKLLQSLALAPVAAVVFFAVSSAAAPEWLARQITGPGADLKCTRYYQEVMAREHLREQAVDEMVDGKLSEEAVVELFRMTTSNQVQDMELVHTRIDEMASEAAPGKIRVINNRASSSELEPGSN